MRVADLDEIPEDGMGHAFQIDGFDIAFFQWNELFYALENFCPHLGFPLTEGSVQKGEIVCGWHGWHIRMLDGSSGKGRSEAKTYSCEVRGKALYVEIPN